MNVSASYLLPLREYRMHLHPAHLNVPLRPGVTVDRRFAVAVIALIHISSVLVDSERVAATLAGAAPQQGGWWRHLPPKWCEQSRYALSWSRSREGSGGTSVHF